MFENMFEKALKHEKRLTMVYYREKMVARDALCPINVMYAPNVANLSFLRIVPKIAF